MPWAEGLFEDLERINDNAYKVDLPGEYEVSAMFNVADLSPFHPDDSQANLRIKSFQQGGTMESYLAKTKFIFNQVQKVQEQGPKCKGWLTFC